MTRRSGPRFEITRIGWKDARDLIAKGYKLQELVGGTAELLNPPGEVMGGRHSIKTGAEAVYYLTRNSLRLLKANRRRDDGTDK